MNHLYSNPRILEYSKKLCGIALVSRIDRFGRKPSHSRSFLQKNPADMKKTLYCLAFLAVQATAQNTMPVSPMDAHQYGVVLEHPGMQQVVVKPDVRYLDDAKGQLHMDVYLPPGLKKQENAPPLFS